VGLKRLALRPFTFSNGVTIPAGTLLGLPLHSVHTDEDIYSNAHEFDGFRFFKLREKEGDDVLAARHQFVTTSPELLGFGLGRHAWWVTPASFAPGPTLLTRPTHPLSLILISPGRFLAANVVKALLARILITYDFKFEEGEGVPRERRITSFRRPGNANVLFRKRQK